jgi:putative ABC transport system permease protein
LRVVVGLLAWLMGGSPLLWSVLAGAVVLALLCGLVGWGLLWLLKRLTLKALPLRLAVNRLLRQPWSTLSQLAAFSCRLCCWRCCWCCAAICLTAGSSSCRKARTTF